MTKFLVHRFIGDYNNTKNNNVRQKYGYLVGLVGIIANFILFAVKLTFGLIIGSIAITADAFNNLTDIGSSIVTMIGFKITNLPADREHPFGYGRIEYSSLSNSIFVAISIYFD